MDKQLLKTAQRGLVITDVALRDSRTMLGDEFEPKYQALPGEIQLMQRTLRSETMELNNNGDDRKIFRVFVKLGVRWVREVDDRQQADESEVQAVMEATFLAEYAMTDAIEQPALDESAMHNAPWHIWPYWREYVASQSDRLNLPKVTLPMQCLPTSRDKSGKQTTT